MKRKEMGGLGYGGKRAEDGEKLSVNPWTAINTNLAAGHPVSPAPFYSNGLRPGAPTFRCSGNLASGGSRGLRAKSKVPQVAKV